MRSIFERQNVQILIATAIVVLWPFLNFYNENRGELFPTKDLFTYALFATAVLVGGTYAISSLLRIPLIKVAIPTTLIWVCFFNFGTLTQIPGFLSLPNWFQAFVWFSIAAGAAWLGCKVSEATFMPSALGISALALIFLPSVSLGSHILKMPKGTPSEHAPIKTTHTAFKQRPNIYLLLLDAYPRSDTLSTVLSFDNSSFLDALRARGFSVADGARSNYPFTNASVASLLTMDYLHESSDDRLGSFIPELRGDNAVVRRLKAEGYRYALASSGAFMKISCGGHEDVCLGRGRTREMENALASLTPLPILLGKAPWISGWFKKTSADFLLPSDLSDLFEDLEGPYFVFAHFGGVHDAIYEEDCRLSNPSSPRISNEYMLRRFTVSVACSNREVIPLLDAIVAKDPDAVILIQSDHGPHIGFGRRGDPKLWVPDTERAASNKFGVLSAMRLPVHCRDMHRNDHSSVNTFRIVFSCLDGTAPALLDHYSYFPDPISKRINEVTVR